VRFSTLFPAESSMKLAFMCAGYKKRGVTPSYDLECENFSPPDAAITAITSRMVHDQPSHLSNHGRLRISSYLGKYPTFRTANYHPIERQNPALALGDDCWPGQIAQSSTTTGTICQLPK